MQSTCPRGTKKSWLFGSVTTSATAYAPPANESTPENVPKMCHFRWRQERTFRACLPHPIIDHFSAQKDLSVPLKLQATLSSPPLRLRALISSQLILIERGAKLGHLTSTSFRSWYATQDKMRNKLCTINKDCLIKFPNSWGQAGVFKK